MILGIATDAQSETSESLVETMESEIAQFFSECRILITGGLDFMGQLLIEKLLRCCPNVITLYILVREKNGKNSYERVQQLAEMPLYERLRSEQPDFLRKITVIEGNLDTMNLGLSSQDRDKLLDTNVIFHGVTNIRSNQRFRTMINVNVRATKQMLLLAKEMPKLKAFVYVSTVFAHSPIKSIEERHYPPPMETDKILMLTNVLNDNKLEAIASTLIDNWPNTFAFTKAIAEDTVLRYGDGIPACIVRLSVVASTWNEPIASWADNVYGPIVLLGGSSLGLLRTKHCHTNKNIDFVPADYVTSALIAAASCTDIKYTRKRFKANEETDGLEQIDFRPDMERAVPVYNYVSSCQKPMSLWDKLQKQVRVRESSAEDARRQCAVLWNSRPWVCRVLVRLHRLLPAVMVNSAVILTGQVPRWYETYNLKHVRLPTTSHFATKQWYFEYNAMVKLWERMSTLDRKIFHFDMSDFNWDEYIKRMIYDARRFVNDTPWNETEKKLAEYVEY